MNAAKEAEVTIYTIFFNTKADTLARLRNPSPGGPGPLGIPPSSPLPFPMPQPTPTPRSPETPETPVVVTPMRRAGSKWREST